MDKELEYKEITPNGNNIKKHLISEIKEWLALRYKLLRNELTLEIEITSLQNNKAMILDDPQLNSMWLQLQLDGYKISIEVLFRIINSHLTVSYNPLKEYIKNLPAYDKATDYIQQLAETVLISDIAIDKVKLKDLWTPYLKKWLIGCVATVIGKGTNHLCLILDGKQGIGKTNWLNKLCPENMQEYLICSHIIPSLTEQNTCNFLAEKWLVNIDDQLETIFGKEFNSMKAIITAPFVTNRKTWHKFLKKRPRTCSFMGTVNNHKFLTDNENRRYLVFQTEKVNYEHNIDMNMVWSQVYYELNNNVRYWLSPEEINQLNNINKMFRKISLEEEWLMKLYIPSDPNSPNVELLMLSDILQNLNINSGLKLSIRKLSYALENLGFHHKISKRINGNPRYVYPVIEKTIYDKAQLNEEIRKELAELKH